MRLLMTAFVFGIPETKMRCISPQVGGGFGSKIFLYPEYVLVAALAEKLGRPVKWIESRVRELPGHHPRARPHHLPRGGGDAATGRSRRSRRRRTPTSAAILSTIAPGIPTTLYGRMLSGCLRDPEHPLPGRRRLHEHRRWSTPTAAPAAPRRRTSSSAPSTSSRASSGWTRSTSGAGTSSRPMRSRTTRRHPAAGSRVRLRRLREGARPGARDASATRRFSGSRRPPAAEGRYLGIGFSTLRRDLRCRSVEVDRAARRGLGRRALGERERPRPPDRQGRRHDRLASRTARATRRRVAQVVGERARRPDRGRDRRARRHARHAVRLRHLRQPERRGRRRRGLQRASRRSRTRRGGSRRTCSRPTWRTSSSRNGRAFVKGAPDSGEDDPGDRAAGRASATTCRRARSRSSTTPPTTTRRTARSRSARTSPWSRSTPRRAR